MVESILCKLRGIIENNINTTLEPDSITYESSLRDIGINSISFIRIVVDIESEYGFEFGDENLDLDNEEFSTLGSLANYIAGKTAAPKQ